MSRIAPRGHPTRSHVVLRLVAAFLPIVLLSGCARTFHVNPSHVEQARRLEAERQMTVTVAAREGSGRNTFLRLDGIKQFGEVEPGGLQRVRTGPRPTDRIVMGFAVLGVGSLLTAGGVQGLMAARSAREDGHPVASALIGASAMSVLVPGIALDITGLSLTISGFSIQDAEAKQATPGLPSTVDQALVPAVSLTIPF